MKIRDFQDPKKSQSDFWETGNSEGISQFTENFEEIF